MSERLISVLMVIAAVYGALFFLNAKNFDMTVIFAVLVAVGFYTVHVTWTAPIFAEDMPAADLKQLD
ncbi:hypothetical protein J7E70_07955 [Variovorax paradoxus]|nr:hypothetical protein [Variovorax paradoxus]MBT2300397.1 hypothetical protein [Variovorax paradoxus]